jgi:beta-lactamase regulating signal transducer with metallopeptidase domain
MAYGLLVGCLLAGAAALGERVLRSAGRPTRWIWAAALGLTVALVAVAPQRVGPVSGPALAFKISEGVAGPVVSPDGWSRAVAAAASLASAATRPVRWAIDAAVHAVPQPVDAWLFIAWIGVSVGLFTIFAAVYHRYDRARVRWPLTRVRGLQVRVAPNTGPAVVGLSNPEIVVPGWLLERSPEEQRLVLAHEHEHVIARDPLLLALACIAAVIVPWHPAVWWMLSRLRLAVELDCDERVLRRGVAAKSYGTLLIDLAGRCSGLRIGAPALADESSHLQQRLIAMTSRNTRPSLPRIVAATLFAAVAILAACEAKLPTATEVDNMTAESAANLARKSQLLSQQKEALDAKYVVDGKAVSAAEANAITPDKIATIEITKQASPTGANALITIKTRNDADILEAKREGLPYKMTMPREPGAPGALIVTPDHKIENFTGVILVDGVRVTEAAMKALSPNDILTVEITKGPTAAQLYAAPEAKNGVIRITTTKGAAHQYPRRMHDGRAPDRCAAVVFSIHFICAKPTVLPPGSRT